LVRGWAANVTTELNKNKQSVATEYNCLELKAESRELDVEEKARLRELAKELDKIWALEEIKIRQSLEIGLYLKETRTLHTFMQCLTSGIGRKRLSV
jgi:hypothetical protein